MTIAAACAPPGGGRNPITPRFIRHFTILCLPTPSEQSLKQIFKVRRHTQIPKHSHLIDISPFHSFLSVFCNHILLHLSCLLQTPLNLPAGHPVRFPHRVCPSGEGLCWADSRCSIGDIQPFKCGSAPDTSQVPLCLQSQRPLQVCAR